MRQSLVMGTEVKDGGREDHLLPEIKSLEPGILGVLPH